MRALREVVNRFVRSGQDPIQRPCNRPCQSQADYLALNPIEREITSFMISLVPP